MSKGKVSSLEQIIRDFVFDRFDLNFHHAERTAMDLAKEILDAGLEIVLITPANAPSNGMRDALEFYADSKNYICTTNRLAPVMVDDGEKARAALSQSPESTDTKENQE